METIKLLVVLLAIFHVVLLGIIGYLISRLESVVKSINEEQMLLPKTKKDILEKNKNLEILKNNYNKINKATNKHNLDEVIEQETKELNDMLLYFVKNKPQEIIEILENKGV